MIERWFAWLPEARQEPARQLTHRAAILGSVSLFIVLGALAIAFPNLIESRDALRLEVGEVAPRDILAPHSLTYDSPVLTLQAQQVAIQQVQPVYNPNPDVTRDQINLARAITTYINEVRHDRYADIDQHIEDLLRIESLTVSDTTWEAAINIPDARWDLISNEISALVERTMQRDVRPDTLDATRSSLLNSVASRFSNSEAEIIVAIAEDLIQPNTFFNEELTRQRQQVAADQISIQQRTFEQGQLIVRSNTIVTELDMEALRQFGLLQTEGLQIQVLLGAVLGMVIVTGILGWYVDRFYPDLLHNPPMLILVAVLFLGFLAAANFFGAKGANQPYLYPAAALALLITSLFSAQMAILVIGFLAVLVGLFLLDAQSLEMTAYIMIGGVAGILGMRRSERLNSFFVAGLIIGATNLLVMLTFALTAEDRASLATLVSRSVITLASGLFAAGIALVCLYGVTSLMNLPTNLKLIELMDSNHPLLQQLLREAPGTYQHSLQVANLCELAAEAIGANAQLIRVAAMYHDIGKTLNPYFFAENTAEGMNPHDDLDDPSHSARVIIGHVIEGEKMARLANLPLRIRDFILEHHGTTQVLYFYNQAVERAGGNESAIDIREFTYPGPAPRSRETAIMMLADGCESATRARRPASKAEVEEVVNTIFELRLGEGQLDGSGLTLNDLKIIRQIFIETLQAMYHPRIAYKMRARREEKAGQITQGIVKNLEAPKPADNKREAITHAPITDTQPRKDGQRQDPSTTPDSLSPIKPAPDIDSDEPAI
jgi:hypothetical protein